MIYQKQIKLINVRLRLELNDIVDSVYIKYKVAGGVE